MPPGQVPWALTAYRVLIRLSGPVLRRRTDRRLSSAGILPERRRERLGYPTLNRPDGPLIWIHAASVGESVSALALVGQFTGTHSVLVTTGTATSAAIMADRLPERSFHQFAPLDLPAAVERFLHHWKPDLGVFIESEIWPNQLTAAADRGIPLALVNARLSDGSLRMWSRLAATATHLFRLFDRIVTQDDRTRAALARFLPADTPIRTGGNLKFAIPPPPADDAAVDEWRARLGDRPVWVASSTHPGEDAPILEAQQAIRKEIPRALCIIVPRHAERGPEIAAMAERLSFTVSRRSAGGEVTPDTDIYVADTMGETGLWYRLSPVVFLAGSWGSAGGHNPWEVVALGSILIHGPKVPNAAPDYQRLDDAGAALVARNANHLADTVATLLHDADRQHAIRKAGLLLVSDQSDMPAKLAEDLLSLLEKAT